MAAGVRIDWLAPARVGELQAFIDGHWRRGHVLARDERLLRWQHRSLRDPDRLAVLVAEEAGRIVGMLGFVEFDACVDGERARGGWMTTWLVVPDARGRGLGIELVDHALEAEYDFVGTLAGNAAAGHVLSCRGFVERAMHRWARVFDVEALRGLLGGREVEAGALPERAGARGAFVGACRDKEFLRHRYDEHPRFRYELLRDGDDLAVYRVETVRESTAKVMRVVDFLGRPSLAQAVVDAADQEGVVFADFSCTSPHHAAALEAAGFRPHRGLPERFQPLELAEAPRSSWFWSAPGLGLELERADLYVTRADSDLDRPN